MSLRRQPLAEHLHPGLPRVGVKGRARRGPTLNILLFAATFVTTALASALNQGVDFVSEPATIVAGFPFAITVMTILLFHESGHYFTARAHGVDATLPFFIPGPPIFGTFGAFIRMRTIPPGRPALFDIGASGPWAGFVVAVAAVFFGLQLSEVRALEAGEGGIILGNSLLFAFLTRLVLGVDAEEVTILLHPIALAGWFGFLVTCLNLLPMGQLDGGHVSYAVFGRFHRWISRGLLVFLILLGVGGWPGWFVWAVLLVILGLDHPPTGDPVTPLDGRRVFAAALTLAVLILTFMPEPFSFAERVAPPPVEGEWVPVTAPAPAPGLMLAL